MPMLVLVVDDSMLIRHTVCRFFEERGFAVQSATNGVDALAAISKAHPHLIITDLEMPRMNGNELITELKSRPHTAAIPLVVLTSAPKKSAADGRADFAIRKDIDIDEQLARVVDEVFKARSARAGV
ncbi:MAG TPA: response regulator [Terriglobales bacterium]|jgi:CheY-like chemotaxis protein|nr:response regulator [Terriglobales bacterium]